MPLNTLLPLYDEGKNITGKAAVAVIGKRCVKITANAGKGNPVSVGPADAAVRQFGVACYDAAIGELVPVVKGGVVPIKALGAIVAGAEVEVAAAGQVATRTAGVAIGRAFYDAASTADCYVDLY